jgi:hypothetical protein
MLEQQIYIKVQTLCDSVSCEHTGMCRNLKHLFSVMFLKEIMVLKMLTNHIMALLLPVGTRRLLNRQNEVPITASSSTKEQCPSAKDILSQLSSLRQVRYHLCKIDVR